MRILSDNGFQFYKYEKENWGPIEAAAIIYEVDPESISYDNIPEPINKLYINSIAAFNAGEMNFSSEVFISDKKEIKRLKKYCSNFFREDKIYNCGYLTCFSIHHYIDWVINSKTIKIPTELMMDHCSGSGYTWHFEDAWSEHIPNSKYPGGTIMTPPGPNDDFGAYFPPVIQNTYEMMKHQSIWSLDDGIALLSDPLYIDDNYYYDDYEFYRYGYARYCKEVLYDLNINFYHNAIKTEALKVTGFNEKKVLNYEFEEDDPWWENQFSLWKDCFSDLKVSPFEFLEFVKENDLFDIPFELEFTKETSESGEIKYFWDSDINEDADPVAKEDQSLEDGSQNTIGQNKTFDIEIDDGKNRVIPEQDQTKKIEQVIKNRKRSQVDGLETDRQGDKGIVLHDSQSLCNSPQIVKRKTESEERIVFDFFLKQIGEDYDIVCPGSKTLQYEYFSEPMNIIPSENLESIQRQLMEFCMWLEPFSKESLRSNNHPYYFIQDVISLLKQNKKYFPDKGSKDLNAYLENLKIKFQEFINDIYIKKRLPLFLEALAQETELMGIAINETGIELESSDEKLEQTLKNNDPHARSFKSNHEDANRNTLVQNSDHTRSFVLKVDRWDIAFDGEPIILNDSKPIRYLLEVLKNPKKNIPYSTIVDIVSGCNQTHKTNKQYSEMAKDKEKERLGKDGLTEKSNSEMDCLYTEQDTKDDFEKLEEMYLKLKNGNQREKDGLKEAIRYFERTYCHRVITTKDSIKMGGKISPSKRAKDDSSLIRNSIKGVMKKLKKKSLHRHLELYLHIKNGVKYDPPEDQPLWEIKDT